MTRWTATGTQHGELPGLPATGKPAKVMGIWIHHLAGGKIVESWGVANHLGLIQQIGGLSAVATPEA